MTYLILTLNFSLNDVIQISSGSFSTVECFQGSCLFCSTLFFKGCDLLFFLSTLILVNMIFRFEFLVTLSFMVVFTSHDFVSVPQKNHSLSSLVAFSFFCERELDSHEESGFDKASSRY